MAAGSIARAAEPLVGRMDDSPRALAAEPLGGRTDIPTQAGGRTDRWTDAGAPG